MEQDRRTEIHPHSPLVVLCDVGNEIEASLVLSLLRSEGIESISISDLDPTVHPLGQFGPGRILVLEQDLSRARSLLETRRVSTYAVAVILAAGEGRRMGRLKGLLPVGDRTMIERLVTAYSESLAREILVVVAPDSPVAEKVDSQSAAIVINPDPSRGPLSSLWVAMDEVEDVADAVFLHPVDVPVFDTGLIDRLIRLYDDGEGTILVPTHQGRRGHPVLFGRDSFDSLRQAPLTMGARFVLRRHPESVYEVPSNVSWVTSDLNTPSQWEEFLMAYSAGRMQSE